MIAMGVLYPRVDFEFFVSGINRGDNAGLHVVYSGTVAGAREGAMKGSAVGVAVSLNSYSRSADYSEAGRVATELLTTVAASPRLRDGLRGKVLNVNVPNLARDDVKGVKLTQPGMSCTTADWVRVAGGGDNNEAAAKDTTTAAPPSDAAFGDGIVELPVPLDGTLEDWSKGKRWFRNKPGPARDDQREGYDKRALDDGYVSISVLGVETVTMGLTGEGATGRDVEQIMAAFGDAHGLLHRAA